MKKVITHNGPFHPDDVFAVATLQLCYGTENIEVIRTRDQETISCADVVVDVGSEYDTSKLRFDHHQEGAPVRDNGIPYAAFGLVWKQFGEKVSGSVEVANKVEEKLCQPIDAADNGVQLYKLDERNVAPVEIQSVIFSFHPINDQSDNAFDQSFDRAVTFAREYLERYIKKSKHKEVEKAKAITCYENAKDKRVIIAEEHLSTGDLIAFPEPEVIVSPALDDRWKARVLPVTKEEPFSARVKFPEAWAGKEGDELEKVSGIENLSFCHKGRHLVFANTKEAALKAAEFAK